MQQPRKLRLLKSDEKLYEAKAGVSKEQILARIPDARFLSDISIDEVMALLRRLQS
jgi:hypothetical protein